MSRIAGQRSAPRGGHSSPHKADTLKSIEKPNNKLFGEQRPQGLEMRNTTSVAIDQSQNAKYLQILPNNIK